MKKIITSFSLIALILFGFNTIGLNAQETGCGDFCVSGTIGVDNSSDTWTFLVFDSFNSWDDIELDPGPASLEESVNQYDNSPAYREQFCVKGSLASLCPTTMLVIRVYINGELIYNKNYSNSCMFGSENFGSNFYFDFIANENDVVEIQSNVAPSPFADFCSCKWMGNADITICR